MLQGWMIFQELAAPLAAVFALLAAACAAWAGWGSWRVTRQAAAHAHLNIFLQFSDEYEKLRVALPHVSEGKSAENTYITAMTQPKYQLGVFNICRLFEREHHLHSLGLVPPHIWKIWHADMVELVRHKPVKEFILKNREQFRASFINEIVGE